jgi:hypothetical protein
MKDNEDWRYQAGIFPEQWVLFVATVMDFFQDDKQSVLDVLGMVSQGVDHPKVYRLTDVSALQEGWHEMSLTNEFEFKWKARPDSAFSGVKAIRIPPSANGDVTESFCLLHIFAGAVQRVNKGKAACHDRGNGGRTWKCTNVVCSDDSKGNVGLTFWKEFEDTSLPVPLSIESSQTSSLERSSGVVLASTTRPSTVSVNRSDEPSQSAESQQGGMQVKPFTQALADLLLVLGRKGDQQVSTTVWVCFRSTDI